MTMVHLPDLFVGLRLVLRLEVPILVQEILLIDVVCEPYLWQLRGILDVFYCVL